MEDSSAEERTKLAAERNNMAFERTFLSWLRTGLAGVGGGVAVVRLLSFESPTHKILASVIGILLMLWGIGIFILALVEYERSFERLKHLFPSIEVPIGRRRVVVFMLLVLSILLLFLVI